MSLEIIPFHDEHKEDVIAVILTIQQTEFGIPITAQEQPDLMDIDSHYQKGNGNFWVALIEDKVVGTISPLDIGNNEGALRKMFVKSAYRGPHYQIARRLLDMLLRWCTIKGVQKVYLGTTAQFLAAHRFYEKHGFHEIAKSYLPSAFPIMAFNVKFYLRALTP